MTNTALRGTVILLVAIALIATVVALRVARAQQSERTYTISATPNKVLEPGGDASTSVNITVNIAVSRAFTNSDSADARSVHLHIANDNDGNGCDIIPDSECVNPADRQQDIIYTGSVRTHSFAPSSTTVKMGFGFTPEQDAKIEGDEKIYLALCSGPARDCSKTNSNNKLLATTAVTIVGEKVWADNSDKTDTTTVALKPSQPVAAAFTTGSDSDGYRMNNVRLKFGGSAGGGADDPNAPEAVSVGLHADQNGQPQRRIAALCRLLTSGGCASGPSDSPTAGKEWIYALPEGVLLKPNTRYWVAVSGTKGLLETTDDHTETGAPGWTIRNGISSDTDTSDFFDWTHSDSHSLKMQISGIPRRGAVVVDTDPDKAGAQTALSVVEDRTGAYKVYLDSPPLKKTTVKVASGDRSVASVSTESQSLTFTKGNCNSTQDPSVSKKCWWEPQTVTVKGGFVHGDPNTTITHSANTDEIKPDSLPSVRVGVTSRLDAGRLLYNIGNAASSSRELSSTSSIAQQFTVRGGNYSLTHVQVDFESTPAPAGVTVRVCAKKSAADRPDFSANACSTYTSPAGSKPSDGLHTYEFLGGKNVIGRERYYVVVSGSAGKVRLTGDAGEISSYGWSLDDGLITSTSTSPNESSAWTRVNNAAAKVNLVGRSKSPTPTPTASATASPTPSPTPTPTATSSPTLTPTPTGSPTATPTVTPTPTGSLMPTPTPTVVSVAGVTPSGLAVATRTQATATITWIPGASATGYAVLARAGSDMKFNTDLDGEARSYTFTGLSQKVYTYYVIGKDASGNFRAPGGSLYAAQPVTGPGPPALDVAPSGLSVVRSGSTAIITWTPGADAARQVAAAIISGDSSSRKISERLYATTNSYVFTGLKSGSYTYAVLAFDSYGNYSAPDGTIYYAATSDP